MHGRPPSPNPTSIIQAALMQRRRGKLAERASSAAKAALLLPPAAAADAADDAADADEAARLDALPNPPPPAPPAPAPAPAAAGVLVRTKCSREDSATSAPRPETVTPVLDRSRLVSAVAADASLRTAPSPSLALPGNARRRSLEATGGSCFCCDGEDDDGDRDEELEPQGDLKHSAATPASPTALVETSRLVRFGRSAAAIDARAMSPTRHELPMSSSTRGGGTRTGCGGGGGGGGVGARGCCCCCLLASSSARAVAAAVAAAAAAAAAEAAAAAAKGVPGGESGNDEGVEGEDEGEGDMEEEEEDDDEKEGDNGDDDDDADDDDE